MGELDRPIFIVGHARGGSTALAAIVNWHSSVGPKSEPLRPCGSVTELLGRIRDPRAHLRYSGEVERKDVWFRYFPGKDVFTHVGKELVVEEDWLTPSQREELQGELVGESFVHQRFLSKAPTNSFRVKALRQLFPSAKIVAIYRRGEQVVASWGNRPYGFVAKGKAGAKMSVDEGIRVFSQKWTETLDYLESVRDECGIHRLTYDQLVGDTRRTLHALFDYLELPVEPYVDEVVLSHEPAKWEASIPLERREQLLRMTEQGNAILRSLEREGRVESPA